MSKPRPLLRHPGMKREWIDSGDVRICTQTFGSPVGPPLLLIAGATDPMDRWDEQACEQLANAGLFVVRYDHRDTGESTNFALGEPPYGFDDLVSDALRVLDSFSLQRANVGGMSMGGAVGQRLAIDEPARILTLTLISSSPGAIPGTPPFADLPPMSRPLLDVWLNPPPAPDWRSRSDVIEYMVAAQRRLNGSRGFDEDHAHGLAAKIFDRTSNVASSLTNHWQMRGSNPHRARLKSIAAPTLVIHGTDDPLFPFAHGQALANEIPRTTLIPIDGGGHGIAAVDWYGVVREILAVTRCVA
jgi:pimeloyl-ACP methyl ester carboxylesterase